MLKRLLLLGLLATLLIYGVVHLFLMRFQVGDVYPAYSTLRADPLGTKALYEAVADLPHLEVRRNFRPITKLHPAAATTIIYAGTPRTARWGEEELREVEGIAARGGRIVITFLPAGRPADPKEVERAADAARKRQEKRAGKLQGKATPKPDAKDSKPADKKGGAESSPEDDDSTLSFDSVAAQWGFHFTNLKSHLGNGQSARAVSAGPLEGEVSWHSALTFAADKKVWKTVFEIEDQPVVIERVFRNGTIVLVGDSYLLSNEAMLKERRPKLLAWLIGGSSSVVFDEESHGVSDRPGIVSLVRKYGLQGAVAAFLVVAILFVWKNAAPFVPPFTDSEENGGIIAGKEAGEGFVNLLRRSIPPREVLRVCVAEWKKSFHHGGHHAREVRLESILAEEAARPARQRSAVAGYRAISKALNPSHHLSAARSDSSPSRPSS